MLKSILSVSLLAVVAGAQIGPGPTPNVGITGVVRPLISPTICAAGTHILECTGVVLQSNSIDLSLLEGQLVKLFGNQSNATCPLIDVTAAANPPSTLVWCGTPSPNCPLKFKLCPGGLSQFWLFLGLAPGYKPLDPAKGTWLLGDPFLLFAAGMGGFAACHEVNVTVPNVPSIIGLDVWLQGARRDIGPVGPISLTNAICFKVIPSLGVCTPTNC